MVIKETPQLIRKVPIKIAQSHKLKRFSLKPFMSVMALLLIFSLNLIGLFGVGETIAYYYDTELSKGNFLGADLLDFILETQGGWRTQTQGGWGAGAHGNNPATYRDANFTGAFPSGVTIGNTDGFTALFTSASAIESFLPAGSTAGSFTQNYTDPVVTSAGVLAGQTLALALNIGFDNYDPNFGANTMPLADWEVVDGPAYCNGMTVQHIFDEANKVLAGAPSSFSASEANNCTDYINNKFDDGLLGQPELNYGDVYKRDIKVLEDAAGVNWKYQVRAEKISGSDDFCNVLNLKAFIDNTEVYSGSLIGFISGPYTFSQEDDLWTFWVELPLDAPSMPNGETCEYKFIYEGWQGDFPIFPFGFHDVEEIITQEEITADDSLQTDDEMNENQLDSDSSFDIILDPSLESDQDTPSLTTDTENTDIVNNQATDEITPEITNEIIDNNANQSQMPPDEALIDGSNLQSELLDTTPQDEIPPAPVNKPIDESLGNIAETNVSLPEEIIIKTENITAE
ncbi:MAG: hypothetical protein Q7S77_01055 [Candidatus Staskawiczbacteria bacterium]|nr:hypothetical protein [Candidatus Staskawiczbacteria bacterium]